MRDRLRAPAHRITCIMYTCIAPHVCMHESHAAHLAYACMHHTQRSTCMHACIARSAPHMCMHASRAAHHMCACMHRAQRTTYACMHRTQRTTCMHARSAPHVCMDITQLWAHVSAVGPLRPHTLACISAAHVIMLQYVPHMMPAAHMWARNACLHTHVSMHRMPR